MSILTYGSSALAIQEPLPMASKWLNDSTSYCRDDVSVSFTDISEMLEFLTARENKADWLTGEEISKLSLLLLGDSICVHTSSTEVVNDTTSGTELVLKMSHNPQIPLRICAIPSLLARAKISGAALNKVEKYVFRDILNECLKVASKTATAQIRFADDKISAVLSSEYVPLSMPKIFEMATEYLVNRFPRLNFSGGHWSHTLTGADIELTGEDSLIQTYKDALTKHSVKHEELHPGISLTSSDIGVSGVNLVPKLVIGKDAMSLPLGRPLGLEHKGDASFSKLSENLDGVFSLYGEHLRRLAMLLDVEIANPVSCIIGVMKRIGIQKKYAMPAIESFSAKLIDGCCTAHDIYFGLGELLFLLQMDNAAGEQILRMEESIAKALVLNFKEYDYPGDVKW